MDQNGPVNSKKIGRYKGKLLPFKMFQTEPTSNTENQLKPKTGKSLGFI